MVRKEGPTKIAVEIIVEARADPEMDKVEAMVPAIVGRAEIVDLGEDRAPLQDNNRIPTEAIAQDAGDASHKEKVGNPSPHPNFSAPIQ
tara:strand:- start:480 stop:746 length:267 start_codon:yes stop_codon:yes gene_type:complete